MGTKAADCLKRKTPTGQRWSFMNKMTHKKMATRAAAGIVGVSIKVLVNKVLAS